MKVVLISGHAADAHRKTGFHFWAEILENRGIDVDFVTVGVSPISRLKRNGKILNPPFNTWVPVTKRIRKYVWMPAFHPLYMKSTLLQKLTYPLFSLYAYLMPDSLLAPLKQADMFIIENGSGLMLVPRLAKLNPAAKFIYNFCDRFDVVKFHPIVEDSQKAALPHFSMIRLNASAFKKDFPPDVETTHISQSIDKEIFDCDWPSPYQTDKNAVSIGDMIFDATVVETIAAANPDWTFHLFGKGAHLSKDMPNVKHHGEVPFETLVPYLKHADIALAPYKNAPNAEYLSESSLKMVQYTYCALPIVAPAFAAKGRAHVLAYGANGVTPEQAFSNAIKFDRQSIDVSSVRDWKDVVEMMLDAPKIDRIRAATFLVTTLPQTLCGVHDFTCKLSDAVAAEGFPSSVETKESWNLANLRAVGDDHADAHDTVFHLQYPSMGMGNSPAQALFGLFLRGRTLVATLHEFSIFSLRRKLIFLLNAPFLKQIIFTNEYERRQFLKFYPFAAKKTAIIPIGSNINVSATDVVRSSLSERIIYFGQIAPGKGIEFFLDTVRLMRARGDMAKAAIIGSILDENSDLTLRMRKACAEDGIELLTNLPSENVSREMHRSTIALLPFPDGITDKRGSALACMRHGITVITCHSEKTPEWLLRTTYAAETPEKALATIDGLMGGTLLRDRDPARLDAEMRRRQWDDIARQHISLYKTL